MIAATTPGNCRAACASPPTMRACACGLRRIIAWSMPGRTISSVKWPRPVAWRGPSLLRVGLPINCSAIALRFYLGCGFFDRVDDLRIARAHAEIACERAANFLLARIGILLQ